VGGGGGGGGRGGGGGAPRAPPRGGAGGGRRPRGGGPPRGAARRRPPAARAAAGPAAGAPGAPQRLWPAAAGRAEAAWLERRSPTIPDLIDETLELAVRREQPWAIGELAFWSWRAGVLDEVADGAAEPFALQIAGDWRAAADVWERLGCPYEVALALVDSDEPEELLRALRILGGLGAAPLGDVVAARLRELGVHDLPRRPSRTTLDNPAGLTDRQLEVLALLTEGRTNVDIAGRLHISPKTAGHHVSAILDKLEVADRHEAARVARDRGLVLG
jgi:DNA-binding CsgD family transcriptional regulator